MMELDFNKKGERCAFIGGKKCPGCSVGEEKGVVGCPEWCSIQIVADDGTEPLWKGCGVMINKHLSLGVAKGANRAAASVQSARNEIARGFLGVVKSIEGAQVKILPGVTG